jgi:SAM-dependent methyltransferase
MKELPPSPDVIQFTPEQQLESVRLRLEQRRTYINAKIDRILRQDVPKTAPVEGIRAWMDSFAKGVGVDICCGNYLTEGAIGVDSAYDVVGNSYNFRGDNLANFPATTFDYVVCNYFDCFENPLKTLNEWHRILKVGGKVAFVCSNADCYQPLDLPLNGKRQFLYTPHTMELYMSKIFKQWNVQTHRASILTWGVK